MSDSMMVYPNGTVIRITSDRFGPGGVGRIGTITDNYPFHIDGLAYAVILEGSPAGTFHQCGAGDFEVTWSALGRLIWHRGEAPVLQSDPFTDGKRGDDIGNLYGDATPSPLGLALNNARVVWAWVLDYVRAARAGARAFEVQLKSIPAPAPVTDPKVRAELERRVQAAERLRRFTKDGRPYCSECGSPMLFNTLDPGGFVCNYCGHSLKGCNS